MKKSQFEKIVRSIVAEELKKILPQVVSEMYLRKLVNESGMRSSASGWDSNSLEDDQDYEYEDNVPHAMRNDDMGIYQDSSLIKKENKLLSDDNPMAVMYKDIAAKSMQENKAQKKSLSNFDFRTINEINKKLNNTQAGYMKKSPEAEMRRIEEMRKLLDQQK